MKLEIITHNEKVNKILSEHPQKDGSSTYYTCGIEFIGSWASRLEQHESFCKTTIGEYIFKLEASAPALKKENEELKDEVYALTSDMAGCKALNAELLEALKGIVEPIRNTFYCEYCDRHAPKYDNGKLTGEPLIHAEDCPMVSAQSAIAKAEGK